MSNTNCYPWCSTSARPCSPTPRCSWTTCTPAISLPTERRPRRSAEQHRVAHDLRGRRRRGGLCRRRPRVRGRIHPVHGASGLHRAAQRPRVLEHRRSSARRVQLPGAVRHSPRACGSPAMAHLEDHVHPSEIGGGFGGKTTIYLEPLAAVLSRKSGRPVKLTMSRAEILRATGPASGGYVRVKIGVTTEGRITAVQAKFALEAGAFPGSHVNITCLCALGPYKLTNFRIDGYDVLVNKPSSHAYRAPGGPQGGFAVESLVDEICGEMGFDPAGLPRLERVGRRRFAGQWHSPQSSGQPGSDRSRPAPLTTGDRRSDRRRDDGGAAAWRRRLDQRHRHVNRRRPAQRRRHRDVARRIGRYRGTRTSVAMQAAETLGFRSRTSIQSCPTRTTSPTRTSPAGAA